MPMRALRAGEALSYIANGNVTCDCLQANIIH